MPSFFDFLSSSAIVYTEKVSLYLLNRRFPYCYVISVSSFQSKHSSHGRSKAFHHITIKANQDTGVIDILKIITISGLFDWFYSVKLVSYVCLYLRWWLFGIYLIFGIRPEVTIRLDNNSISDRMSKNNCQTLEYAYEMFVVGSRLIKPCPNKKEYFTMNKILFIIIAKLILIVQFGIDIFRPDIWFQWNTWPDMRIPSNKSVSLDYRISSLNQSPVYFMFIWYS